MSLKRESDPLYADSIERSRLSSNRKNLDRLNRTGLLSEAWDLESFVTAVEGRISLSASNQAIVVELAYAVPYGVMNHENGMIRIYQPKFTFIPEGPFISYESAMLQNFFKIKSLGASEGLGLIISESPGRIYRSEICWDGRLVTTEEVQEIRAATEIEIPRSPNITPIKRYN